MDTTFDVDGGCKLQWMWVVEAACSRSVSGFTLAIFRRRFRGERVIMKHEFPNQFGVFCILRNFCGHNLVDVRRVYTINWELDQDV
jgi:hypothetical protein